MPGYCGKNQQQCVSRGEYIRQILSFVFFYDAASLCKVIREIMFNETIRNNYEKINVNDCLSAIY
jgi:hypothetical protein